MACTRSVVGIGRRICRVVVLDEGNQERVEAPGAPIVEVPIDLVAGELRDQRPGGVAMNEEGLALGIFEMAPSRPDGEGKRGRGGWPNVGPRLGGNVGPGLGRMELGSAAADCQATENIRNRENQGTGARRGPADITPPGHAVICPLEPKAASPTARRSAARAGSSGRL